MDTVNQTVIQDERDEISELEPYLDVIFPSSQINNPDPFGKFGKTAPVQIASLSNEDFSFLVSF